MISCEKCVENTRGFENCKGQLRFKEDWQKKKKKKTFLTLEQGEVTMRNVEAAYRSDMTNSQYAKT